MDATDSRRSAERPPTTDTRANCGLGAIVDLESGPSHRTIADALDLLASLEHRGATGAEPDTGDGAGIMLQRPDAFFDAAVDADLPDSYAVGSLFFPQDAAAREDLMDHVEAALAEQDLTVLAWRDVPTENDELGETALASEPDVWQVFVAPDDHSVDAFDRALYVARREVETGVEREEPPGHERFYVCSLDRKRLVYKGLLTSEQFADYFPDLRDPRLESAIALVHARFSTNTLGAWHLAHPYRTVVHNGEFNTIRGNVNWMRAREDDLAHQAFGDDLDSLKPIISDPEQSDTASLDNTLELLTAAGRDVPHALRMLIPEAFRGDDAMTDRRQAFYDYHASLVEPWDGPALVIGTDGDTVAAALDRNGLRPCRYDVTADGRLIMASEAGALETPPDEIERRDRLSPGQLLVADTEAGHIVPDEEVFDDLADEQYAEWVGAEQQTLPEREQFTPREAPDQQGPVRTTQAAFGYSRDELDHLVEPMAREGTDPVGSMGDDTPLSVLTGVDRPLFSYFKQLFAQVSNPPIDYIREELVTSLESRLGPQQNLLGESRAHARQLVLDSPVLTDDTTASIKAMDGTNENGLRSVVVDTTFGPDQSLEAAVENVRAEATAAIEEGADLLVLSDRAVGPERAPVPSLLATGAVHHELVRNGLRNHAGLVVESGDPREVHHLATLVGYGAGAVNPSLAYRSIEDIVAGADGAPVEEAVAAYIDALEEGLLKTMAKMGISTVESYRGAQIFEAVGLDEALVEEYFEGTRIRTGGIDLETIGADVRERHATAFEDDDEPAHRGEYEHRSSGLQHEWNPETTGTLQQAVRAGDYEQFQEFTDLLEDQSEGPRALRSLLWFDSDREPVDIEDVESLEEIVTRFSTAAMSLGSLSPEAHENNAVAMNRIGGKSNTGEGGEPPERFGTERASTVKQVASGRFGVTAEYLRDAEEMQIKMAQGSKPGEGGHLPGSKVNEYIAQVRYATPGVGLISPPPLHDIYSIEDLKQLIFDLKAVNPEADVNVKLVSEDGIGTIAAGVAKANADVLHVSGHDGGTGASPKSSIKNAGLPWELGLVEANQYLRATGLRDRVRVSVDGGLKTGRDVAVAALLGAEEFVFGTASLVTSGCVMARQCHENTCPVGIATQDEDLRQRFPGEPDHVINFMTFVAQELREYMAELGVTSVDELVGRPEWLTETESDHPRAAALDLSAVVAPLEPGARRKRRGQTHAALADHIDHDLVAAARPTIEEGEPVRIHRTLSNADRAVGALLSGELVDAGVGDLPDDSVRVTFDGTAGQSFGAFCTSGVTMELTGAANDYVGKGLSGGKLVVKTPPEAPYEPEENILVGNVTLYGATDGELYVEGKAGERFAVRNSGVRAVVEGVGDHACEYMTGGAVAVLGETGTNFAAGMSGGVAYVYDPDGTLADRVNTGMVTLSDDLGDADEAMLRRLLENHATHTDSDRATALLADWSATLDAFTRVLPDAYRRVVREEGREDVRDDLPEPATGPTCVRSASTGD